jgi:hypothetical protein
METTSLRDRKLDGNHKFKWLETGWKTQVYVIGNWMETTSLSDRKLDGNHKFKWPEVLRSNTIFTKYVLQKLVKNFNEVSEVSGMYWNLRFHQRIFTEFLLGVSIFGN